jgi:hypothetical protein
MARGKRGDWVQAVLSSQEWIALEDFRYSRRMPSRTAAARELLRRGLAAEGFEVAAFSTKSKGFDVVGPSAKARDSE